MHSWLENTLAKLSKKSDTAAAIRNALSRWRALTRYLDDGTLEIHITPPNVPCVSSPLAARTSSSSVGPGLRTCGRDVPLLGSTKHNGLDPKLHLQYVLERIAAIHQPH